ncbi:MULTISPECIES: hypothetical protein [unclassified Leptolyngbya]|uniref:hypothetical protein n=1 Tax=unclassified Leptolyngbya TaxID=2650499 RepID=UPI0016895C84|nr:MULTISPECIES: hypothetical protein [unclassified Leptolyngbya]MBD1911007.1 hypothetical protein [Leptolyngbya sp. FACHB-8]MBD2158326.1 hypothetical protein [Leptolyngbya sp. FACHB-16]
MTIRRAFLLMAFSLTLTGLTACSPAQAPEQQATTPSTTSASTTAPSTSSGADPAIASATPAGDLTILFSKIWRVSSAPSDPAPGSINVFLPNGTLLQTSCVETYAISGWTADREVPNRLQVTEGGQPVYNAEILELSNTTLRLRLNLIPSNETQEITYTAVEDEFTCPDLPR